MDNVGIVVEDLKVAIAFFEELGLELEGEMTVEGQWVDRVVGLHGVRNDIAMMRTPDGHSRLELMKFQKPAVNSSDPNAPVNALGIRRMMFLVTDIDELWGRLQRRGAKLLGEMVQYGDSFRLCYLRGPDGIIIALAQKLGDKSEKNSKKSGRSELLKMDNVLIVVNDLEAARAFFSELGLDLQGETVVEGPTVDKLIALRDVRATLALMWTPDGHGGVELDKFHTPDAIRVESVDTPVNTLGIRRLMFAVGDIDDMVMRLRALGAELMGEVTQYEDMYKLCYLRGPEGIIVALAEQLGNKSAKNVLQNARTSKYSSTT
jgi:catechol 2,3-dioxygenase-like lactoylglutathione lyase family enzyme